MIHGGKQTRVSVPRPGCPVCGCLPSIVAHRGQGLRLFAFEKAPDPGDVALCVCGTPLVFTAELLVRRGVMQDLDRITAGQLLSLYQSMQIRKHGRN